MLEGRLARWAPAALLLLLLAGCGQPEGPAPVAWDRTRCAHCGMLVSDPSFAAQLQTGDGEVQHFDDPGCLLVSPPAAAGGAPPRLWFRHHEEDRWIAGDAVAFRRRTHTPMGYGLGAVVAADAPDDALTLAQAREIARERDRRRDPSHAGMHP